VRRKEIERKARQAFRTARYASLGIEVGLSVVVGAGLGWWIDGQFDSGPWGLIGGVILGTVTAFRSLYLTTTRFAEEEEREAQDAHDE
jgi:F0F1-type ATP synthase assembly protein I